MDLVDRLARLKRWGQAKLVQRRWENLRRMGVDAEELPDGLVVPGRQQFRGAALDSYGDHRIAMAFAVAALRAAGPCSIAGADAASVSFPEFWDTLRGISA